ncbi:hypothetical protein Aduo_003857 [Ancylostoma duodenale]
MQIAEKGQEREEQHPDEGETQLSLEEAPTQKKIKEKMPPKESDKTLMKSSTRPLASDTTGTSGTGGNEKKQEGSLPKKDRRALASARLKRLRAETSSKKQELKKEDVKKEDKESSRGSVRSKFKSVRETFSRLGGKESKREEPKKSKGRSVKKHMKTARPTAKKTPTPKQKYLDSLPKVDIEDDYTNFEPTDAVCRPARAE